MPASEARERRFVVDGLPFRAFSAGLAGSEPGAPFVLVHGIGVSHRYLDHLFDVFAKTAEVHSIDLPGFGGLAKPDGDVDVPQMAGALGEVLDRLDLRGCVLVGHSMGTQWVTELAIQRPDLAHRVVLMGPVADRRHRSFPAQAVALTVDTLGEPPTGNLAVLTDYLRCGPLWYLAQLRHMLAYPLETRLRDVIAPVLIVRGGSDPIAGLRWCRRLRAVARNGALVEMPRHRHLVQWTAPRTVRAAIVDWLARL